MDRVEGNDTAGVAPVRSSGCQLNKGPFKCYVTQMGVGVSTLPEKSVTKV